MNIEDENYTVTIDFKHSIDGVIFEQEKMLLLQYLPDLYVEMQKELTTHEE